MKKQFGRIKYGEEPTLHVHRYIAIVHECGGKQTYHYCINLKEIEDLKGKIKKDECVEVYTAHHNFREAWVRHK